MPLCSFFLLQYLLLSDNFRTPKFSFSRFSTLLSYGGLYALNSVFSTKQKITTSSSKEKFKFGNDISANSI